MAGKEFPLSLVVKAVDRATAPLRKVSERITKLSATTAKVGAAASAALTAPMAALGLSSARAFASFESGMTDVSTLLGDSTESIEAMGREVLAIGRRTPVAINDLTSAIYDVRSAGISAEDQFKVLEGSARLAVAGLGSTQEAVDLVTSSINAFNLSGEEQARVYDVIFKTVKNGKTNVAGIAQGFGAVAGTVASAGVQLDEYLASVAALTTTGLPAAQAHTQLRAVISGLTRETKDASALFRHLGAKSFKDLIAKSGGMVPALQRISKALRGNEKDILDMVGSTEALNAIIGLAGGQSETFANTLRDMRDGANAVDEAYEKQNAAAAKVLQRLSNQMESFKISIGRTLVPILGRLTPILEKLSLAWEGLSPGMQEAIVLIGGLVAVLGPVLAMVGLMMPVFAALTAPMLGVVAAVGLLAAAAYLLYRNWDDIALFFKLLWQDVKGAFATARKWMGEFIAWTPLRVIADNWEPITEFFSSLWDGVVGVFEWAWEKIKPIADKVMKIAEYTPIGMAWKWGKIGLGLDDGPQLPEQDPPSAERARPRRLDEVLREHSVKSQAEVKVDFANLPKGARVTTGPNNSAPIDLSMGYSMVTP